MTPHDCHYCGKPPVTERSAIGYRCTCDCEYDGAVDAVQKTMPVGHGATPDEAIEEWNFEVIECFGFQCYSCKEWFINVDIDSECETCARKRSNYDKRSE
jgi:hypothetical protein